MKRLRRVLCDLHLLIGVSLIAYAVAFMLTPNVSTIAWIRDTMGIRAEGVVGLFLICALIILILRPPPRWLAVCSSPLLMFAFCVVLWALTTHGPASGIVAYIMAMWLLYRSIYRLIER